MGFRWWRASQDAADPAGRPTAADTATPELAPGKQLPHVLLGVTGSVAAIKAAELARLLCGFADVRVVVTQAAKHFTAELAFPDDVQIYDGDEQEWHAWRRVGDPVLHIELRKWADLLLIAPLSANSLAKVAQGLCDNCLTSVVRAWDFSKPMLVAPAMNTFMWESPFTRDHLAKLKALGVQVVAPVAKQLACGDVGVGALAAPADIAAAAQKALSTQLRDEWTLASCDA